VASVAELTHTGQKFYRALAQLVEDDPDGVEPLVILAGALAVMFDQVADLSRDTDDTPGWGIIMDPELTPFIEWLAQFPGVVIPGGLDDPTAREWLSSTDGRNRGTPAAIEGAAKTFLVAAKTVFVIERFGGSAYRLQVTTLASQTPDPARVEAMVKAQKPAGIVLTYSAIKGGDYQSLRDTHVDYADVKATFKNYTELRSEPERT
jgi:hypothetical protein